MTVETAASRVGSVEAAASGGVLRLLVDETIYSREAVLRACYWFTDRCYLFISREAPGRLEVTVRAKPGGPALEAVAGEFSNALLDQQVRLDIERETRVVRELIVAKAFAESGVLEDPPVGDDRDPVELALSGSTSGTPGSLGKGKDE
jgi:His-Xaa-Ser system protein HxsD